MRARRGGDVPVPSIDLFDDVTHSLSPSRRRRLELYGRNLCDHHLVADLISAVSQLQFLGRLGGSDLSKVQSALMVGMGLQAKTVEGLAGELGLPESQVLAMFNKAVRKMSQAIRRALEEEAGAGLAEKADGGGAMDDVTKLTLAEEQEESAKDVTKAYDPNLDDEEMKRYHIKGTEDDWSSALESGVSPTGKLSVAVGGGGGAGRVDDKDSGFKRSANYFEEEEERARQGVGKMLPEKLRKEKKKRRKNTRKVGGLGVD